jgi:hypothetical protein
MQAVNIKKPHIFVVGVGVIGWRKGGDRGGGGGHKDKGSTTYRRGSVRLS